MKGTSRKYQYKAGVIPSRKLDPVIRGNINRLKIEIALGVSHFWRKRGQEEPVSPSFKEQFNF